MRSSKSRSRSKNNRNRSVGNNMNRVFDSSGPEGRVRGTPQQIIDKYNQLAADAQLSNDVVAAENFQQHAEHYTRLLVEAQREQEARRQQQEREHQERQQARSEQQQARRSRDGQQQQPQPAAQPGEGSAATDPGQAEQPDVIAPAQEAQSGLVETPEEAPAKRRSSRSRSRQPRDGDAAKTAPAEDKPDGSQPDTPEAAE